MNITSQPACSLGIVGIHGYARLHLGDALRLRDAGLVGAITAVAHDRALDPVWATKLEASGVRLVSDLDALLAVPGLDLVTLPVGIHLHRPLAERVLAAGHRVYLEKPVAGCLADHDAIAGIAEGRLIVGFQHLFLPSQRRLRQRLAAGEFGAVRAALITAASPRDHAYYQRNRWAGQLAVAGALVCDSPANNACAHQLSLAMFLVGGEPLAVRAALARVNPIPSFDTCGLRVRMSGGAEVLFNASHAGAVDRGATISVVCAKATLVRSGDGPWRVGSTGEEIAGESEPSLVAMRHALAWTRGGADPVCTLAEARHHSRVIAAVHRADIVDLPAALIERRSDRLCCPAVDAALSAAQRDLTTLDAPGLLPGFSVGDWIPCPP